MELNELCEGYPIDCPCCKTGKIKFFHDICDECGWEDDDVQNNDPDFFGGANELSLNEHKKMYQEMKKKNPKYKWVNTLKN